MGHKLLRKGISWTKESITSQISFAIVLISLFSTTISYPSGSWYSISVTEHESWHFLESFPVLGFSIDLRLWSQNRDERSYWLAWIDSSEPLGSSSSPNSILNDKDQRFSFKILRYGTRRYPLKPRKINLGQFKDVGLANFIYIQPWYRKQFLDVILSTQ